MNLYKICLFFSVIFLIGCSSTNKNEDDTIDELSCTTTEFSITEQDNIVMPDAVNPVIWKGGFSDNQVKIHFTIEVDTNGETEQFNFVFKKQHNCLTIDYAYKFYDGKDSDISALTTMQVSEFYIKEWIENQKFTGILVYKDPHDKLTYSRKFWLEFTDTDRIIEETNFNYFNDCLGGKLPIDIDVNNDNIADFQLVYEKLNDNGNSPSFSRYVVKLISTDQNINKILSPVRNTPPYLVVYEPPFSSENTRQYFNGVKNELDIFYEFESPFESYNFFLNNLLTYKGRLGNTTEDYFVISKDINNQRFYGWIKFDFKVLECKIEVLETFLNNTPNEHIFVN